MLASDVLVHVFKHVDTRRYLNLDAAGHAYRYRLGDGAGSYETITSPAAALAELLDVCDDAARHSVARWSSAAVTSPSPSPGLSP